MPAFPFLNLSIPTQVAANYIHSMPSVPTTNQPMISSGAPLSGQAVFQPQAQAQAQQFLQAIPNQDSLGSASESGWQQFMNNPQAMQGLASLSKLLSASPQSQPSLPRAPRVPMSMGRPIHLASFLHSTPAIGGPL